MSSFFGSCGGGKDVGRKSDSESVSGQDQVTAVE
jgi:hypothetical protein